MDFTRSIVTLVRDVKTLKTFKSKNGEAIRVVGVRNGKTLGPIRYIAFREKDIVGKSLSSRINVLVEASFLGSNFRFVQNPDLSIPQEDFIEIANTVKENF